MENNIDYHLIPRDFMHCAHVSCEQANNCLRYRAMQQVTNEPVSLLMLNPARYPAGQEKCLYFRVIRKVPYALGITRLLDHLPYEKALDIKRELASHFERSTYYRIRNKERYIKPSEQKFIRELFKRKGISEEPRFDSYTDQYEL